MHLDARFEEAVCERSHDAPLEPRLEQVEQSARELGEREQQQIGGAS